jgi:hypothetical protein
VVFESPSDLPWLLFNDVDQIRGGGAGGFAARARAKVRTLKAT